VRADRRNLAGAAARDPNGFTPRCRGAENPITSISGRYRRIQERDGRFDRYFPCRWMYSARKAKKPGCVLLQRFSRK